MKMDKDEGRKVSIKKNKSFKVRYISRKNLH